MTSNLLEPFANEVELVKVMKAMKAVNVVKEWWEGDGGNRMKKAKVEAAACGKLP